MRCGILYAPERLTQLLCAVAKRLRTGIWETITLSTKVSSTGTSSEKEEKAKLKSMHKRWAEDGPPRVSDTPF